MLQTAAHTTVVVAFLLTFPWVTKNDASGLDNFDLG